MEDYVKEKLSLAGRELTGGRNRRTLQHVVLRTLVAIEVADLPEPVRPRYEEAREVLLRKGKLSSVTFAKLTDDEVKQVWRALLEVCRAAGA